MIEVKMHEAKTRLSRLVAEAEAGGEVVIFRGNKPVARLIAFQAKPKRIAGKWKGQIQIGPEFFEPMPAKELALWEDGKVF